LEHFNPWKEVNMSQRPISPETLITSGEFRSKITKTALLPGRSEKQ
jgi:hypothetical protein